MASITIFGKTIDLIVLWRHVKTIGITSAAMWASIIFVAGDYFAAKADGALVEMLERQGMSPKDFKKMQGQLSEMSLEMDNLGTAVHSLDKTSDGLVLDLNTVKGKVDIIDGNAQRTYDLLKALMPRIRSDISP